MIIKSNYLEVRDNENYFDTINRGCLEYKTVDVVSSTKVFEIVNALSGGDPIDVVCCTVPMTGVITQIRVDSIGSTKKVVPEKTAQNDNLTISAFIVPGITNARDVNLAMEINRILAINAGGVDERHKVNLYGIAMDVGKPITTIMEKKVFVEAAMKTGLVFDNFVLDIVNDSACVFAPRNALRQMMFWMGANDDYDMVANPDDIESAILPARFNDNEMKRKRSAASGLVCVRFSSTQFSDTALTNDDLNADLVITTTYIEGSHGSMVSPYPNVNMYKVF